MQYSKLNTTPFEFKCFSIGAFRNKYDDKHCNTHICIYFESSLQNPCSHRSPVNSTFSHSCEINSESYPYLQWGIKSCKWLNSQKSGIKLTAAFQVPQLEYFAIAAKPYGDLLLKKITFTCLRCANKIRN